MNPDTPAIAEWALSNWDFLIAVILYVYGYGKQTEKTNGLGARVVLVEESVARNSGAISVMSGKDLEIAARLNSIDNSLQDIQSRFNKYMDGRREQR